MLKEKFKKYTKKEQFKIWAVTSVMALVLMLFRWKSGFIRNISDYFCIIGLLHIIVGSTRYIRNVGLFKTFSYMAYKRRTRKAHAADGVVIRPMDMAEYTQKYIYADIYQKDVKWPLLHAFAFLAISIALAFVV